MTRNTQIHTCMYQCKYTFTLGQTQMYIYKRVKLGYVFAFTCARLYTYVSLHVLVSDQFWSSTSFGHICFKMFVA